MKPHWCHWSLFWSDSRWNNHQYNANASYQSPVCESNSQKTDFKWLFWVIIATPLVTHGKFADTNQQQISPDYSENPSKSCFPGNKWDFTDLFATSAEIIPMLKHGGGSIIVMGCFASWRTSMAIRLEFLTVSDILKVHNFFWTLSM